MNREDFIQLAIREGILTRTYFGDASGGAYYTEDQLEKLLMAYDHYKIFLKGAKSLKFTTNFKPIKKGD